MVAPGGTIHEETCCSGSVSVRNRNHRLGADGYVERQIQAPQSARQRGVQIFRRQNDQDRLFQSPRQGRKIFGEASDKALVSYGEIWRTGANDATTFVTDANVTVDGKAVPAGSYTLFTVPKADEWTLVISKKTGEWGTDYPGEKEDLLRVR